MVISRIHYLNHTGWNSFGPAEKTKHIGKIAAPQFNGVGAA
jgi:hypothetical protein